MRILVVTPLSPWEKGGIEKVVGETTKHLVMNNNFEVQVYCGSRKNRSGSNFWEDIPIKVYKTRKMTGYTSMEMFKDIKRYAREFDIVHAHGFGTLVPLVAALSCGKTPLVLSPHFHPKASTTFLSAVKKFYDPTIGKLIFKKAKHIICDSKTEKTFIKNKIGVEDEKMSVIYNGVDINKFKLAHSHHLQGKLILYVGRLEKYKNVSYIIKAMEYLSEDFVLNIIGTGSYSLKLKRLIKSLELENRVKMLSNVSNDDLCRWMKTCSTFVHLSEIETFGMTCLEALAAGKPVIVNDDKGGLSETASLFNDGIFPIDIKNRSIEDIAKLVKRICQKSVNPNLNDFNWDNIAKKFKEVYQNVK